MDFSGLPTPKEIVDKYDLAPKKSLGQNFLFDLNITRKIVSRSGSINNLNVVEIGPGPGGLTRAILENQPESVTVIEYDDRAIKGLAEFGDLISILNQDALKVDLSSTVKAPCAIIANLPYNISTKLLTNWFSYIQHFTFLTLMFQKEVANRLIAEPRSKSYGRLSVMSQYLCDVQVLFDVPPEAFTPAPKVTSSVVKLIPKPNPGKVDITKLSDVTRITFGKRRKMLKSSLKDTIPDVEKTLQGIGINPQSRPEELSVEEFCKLAELI